MLSPFLGNCFTGASTEQTRRGQWRDRGTIRDRTAPAPNLIAELTLSSSCLSTIGEGESRQDDRNPVNHR